MTNETWKRTIKNGQIRSVAKALKVIEYLASTPRGAPLTQIASKLELAKSTAHGLLSTLRDFGYVEQDSETGNYTAGIRLFEIGSILANSWDVKSAASPNIQRLVLETDETVHLAVLSGAEVLYIDKRESTQLLRIVSQVGKRLPAHCTGVGKVLLAYLPESEVRRRLNGVNFQRFTKNTIVSLERLLHELTQIRERGFAIDNEEIMDSLRCVAAPVFDNDGKICAGISVSAPVGRLDDNRIDEIVKQVVGAAEKTSFNLGYRPF